MTQIICIVQIHQLIYKCELCHILHALLLHFTLNQHTHKFIAHSLANDKQVYSHLIISSEDLLHLTESALANCCVTKWACLFQLVWSLFYFVPSRIHWTLWKHVRAQDQSSHSTRSDFRVGLLWIVRMWTLLGAKMGGAVTPFSHPQILPQAMTVCQWLQRM